MTKAERTPQQHQRILVMDNNKDMLTLLSRTLELEGFDAIVVGEYDEAMELFDHLAPDMVIMDTFISDDDSLQMIDSIRKHSDVPIVVLATNTEVEAVASVLSRGADDFVRKPFSIKPFIARIKAKLRRYQYQLVQPAS